MNNPKHAPPTPGPWRYCRENGSPTTGCHMIAGATPGYLAEVRDCGSGDVGANARLMAAAPELLEAADNALGVLLGCCVPAGGMDDRFAILDAQRQLRAALAKATGSPQ